MNWLGWQKLIMSCSSFYNNVMLKETNIIDDMLVTECHILPLSQVSSWMKRMLKRLKLSCESEEVQLSIIFITWFLVITHVVWRWINKWTIRLIRQKEFIISFSPLLPWLCHRVSDENFVQFIYFQPYDFYISLKF